MVICVDSREKKNYHILAWFDKHGIEYEVKKLERTVAPVSDFAVLDNSTEDLPF